MKKRNVILSITSVLLILLFLAGSTGAVIVKHSCISCGLSDFHTEVFSSVHSHHSCDCKTEKSSCHDETEESLHSECCTFTSEKLSLTEYNNSKFISLSAVILPVLSFCYKNNGEQQEKHTVIPEFHNKHGGRDILQSSCRLII